MTANAKWYMTQHRVKASGTHEYPQPDSTTKTKKEEEGRDKWIKQQNAKNTYPVFKFPGPSSNATHYIPLYLSKPSSSANYFVHPSRTTSGSNEVHETPQVSFT